MTQIVCELVRKYDEKLEGLNIVVQTSFEQSFKLLLDSFPDYYPETVNLWAGRGRLDKIKEDFGNLLKEVQEILLYRVKEVSYDKLSPFYPFRSVAPFKTHNLKFKRGRYPDSYTAIIEETVVKILDELNKNKQIISSDFPKHNHFSISSLFSMSEECTKYIQSIFDLEVEIKKAYTKETREKYEETLEKARLVWNSVT